MRFFRRFFCFCLLATCAFAQRVYWQSANTGDPADLQLVYENCSPDGDPQLPAINGATLSFSGRSDQTSIINFSMTTSVIYGYRLQARQTASITIPAFNVKTNKGEQTVAAYTTGTVQPGPAADVHATLRPGHDTVWAGEVFPLTYILDVARRTFSNFGGPIDWDSTPLLTEDWSKPEASEINRNNESRLIVRSHTRAYAKNPGDIKLQPVKQLLNMAIGTVGFGLFSQPRIEQVSSATDQPELHVKPLPLPAPSSFGGAVGQFKFTSKVVPSSAAVGEPITWTLELTGTGNWPDIGGLPAREVSKDFQVIQPQPKRTTETGKLFDGSLSQDVVLVPTKPGTYTLGAVEFSYFDPQTGSYQTVTTPATTVTITAAPAVQSTGIPAIGNAPEPGPSNSDSTVKPPAPPANPTGLPRDPITGRDTTVRPFSSGRALVLTCLAPFAFTLLCWLGLATRRAKRNDPLRSRREARQRLAATLAQMRTATANTRPALLMAWQHDVARFWPLVHAAPPALALGDATWVQLWQEADRTLYGARVELPSDWVARAEAALIARRVPGFAWWRIFQPGNLLPFLALVVGLLITPTSHAAITEITSPSNGNPIAAYNQGQFAQAEAAWRAAVKKTPTDWIARHNLALALAQQDQWPEAAAQATAAFVQNPRAEAARWDLALAYAKAGYSPTEVAPLLERSPLPDLARQASPAQWEHLLIAAAIILALLAVWLLLVGYGILPRWSKWPVVVLVVATLLFSGACIAGHTAYGIAAQPTAALVWRGGTLYSIPTEADSAQQTTSLAAGTMGTIDKTFLGWVRLTFPNGQTGWVRQGEIVRLWQ